MRKLETLESSFFPSLERIIVNEDCKDVFLVMKLLQCDMRSLLNSDEKFEFSEEHAKYVIYNLLCAVNFMHSANIIHRDIKPANILIND
jgi:serine/threonine protein kinase